MTSFTGFNFNRCICFSNFTLIHFQNILRSPVGVICTGIEQLQIQENRVAQKEELENRICEAQQDVMRGQALVEYLTKELQHLE